MDSNIVFHFSYVWNKEDFDRVDPENTDYLMGLFNPYQMHYAVNKRSDIAGEPSLPEMTRKVRFYIP